MRDRRCEVATKDHVTFTRVGLCVARRIRILCANQQVMETVPVHVTCSAHRTTAHVTRVGTKDRDPSRAQVGQIDGRRQCRTTEDHVALTRRRFRVAQSICIEGSNQQVVKAIPVHVTCSAHGITALVARVDTKDGDPSRAQVGQIEGRRQ